MASGLEGPGFPKQRDFSVCSRCVFIALWCIGHLGTDGGCPVPCGVSNSIRAFPSPHYDNDKHLQTLPRSQAGAGTCSSWGTAGLAACKAFLAFASPGGRLLCSFSKTLTSSGSFVCWGDSPGAVAAAALSASSRPTWGIPNALSRDSACKFRRFSFTKLETEDGKPQVLF